MKIVYKRLLWSAVSSDPSHQNLKSDRNKCWHPSSHWHANRETKGDSAADGETPTHAHTSKPVNETSSDFKLGVGRTVPLMFLYYVMKQHSTPINSVSHTQRRVESTNSTNQHLLSACKPSRTVLRRRVKFQNTSACVKTTCKTRFCWWRQSLTAQIASIYDVIGSDGTVRGTEWGHCVSASRSVAGKHSRLKDNSAPFWYSLKQQQPGSR